jgi:hypothetical protein
MAQMPSVTGIGGPAVNVLSQSFLRYFCLHDGITEGIIALYAALVGAKTCLERLSRGVCAQEQRN